MAQTEFLIAHNASFDALRLQDSPRGRRKAIIAHAGDSPQIWFWFSEAAGAHEGMRHTGQQSHRALDDVMDAIELLRQTNSITGTTFSEPSAGQADGRIAGAWCDGFFDPVAQFD